MAGAISFIAVSILRSGTAFLVHEVHWQDVDAAQCEFRRLEQLLQEIFRGRQVRRRFSAEFLRDDEVAQHW